MVDRVLVERFLGDIRVNVRLLEEAVDIDWIQYQRDLRSRRFVERTLQILVEACINITQHLIVGEGLREPANYRDAFVILVERGILDPRHLPFCEKMAALRHRLAYSADRVDDEEVFGIFQSHRSDFDGFVAEIARYLQGGLPEESIGEGPGR